MAAPNDRSIRLPSGQDVPALGQGTWFMGDRPDLKAEEIKALRRGIDLYLLHWRGHIPLAETIEAFEQLVSAGKIRYWGVSNLDHGDMQELVGVSGGSAVQTDQVLYNLSRRGIEFDLLPWCRSRDIPIMAYSPIEQGRLLSHPALSAIAKAHHATPAQIALAWLLHQEGVIVISKAGRLSHVEDNRRALDVTLSDDDLAALDRAFPPPSGSTPLEML